MPGSTYLLVIVLLTTTPHFSRGCPDLCICEDEGVTVDCSGLGLDSLPPGLSSNITSLDLSNNNIDNLVGSMFEDFTVLETLTLRHNIISAVSGFAFTGLVNLIRLDLSANQIPLFESGTFDSLGEVVEMNLERNNITDDGLSEDLFAMCYRLESLDLSHNQLTFKMFSSNNKISWLWALDISWNPIGQLDYLAMDQMASLRTLNASHSSIEELDSNCFVGLRELQFLYLASNEIDNLKRETFQPLAKIAAIDVSNNPIECACSTKQFQDWLSSSGATLDPTATCTDQETNTQVDITIGNLDPFCESPSPTPTSGPPQCHSNHEIYTEGAISIGKTDASVEFDLFHVVEDDVVEVQYKMIGSENDWQDLPSVVVASSPNTSIVIDIGAANPLEVASAYVCCVSVSGCEEFACSDFTTLGDSNSLTTTELVLIVVLALLAVICSILIAYIMYSRRKIKEVQELIKPRMSTNSRQPPQSRHTINVTPGTTHFTAPGSQNSVPASRIGSSNISTSADSAYGAYECIPIDRLDDRGAYLNSGYLPMDKTPPLSPSSIISGSTTPYQQKLNHMNSNQSMSFSNMHSPQMSPNNNMDTQDSSQRFEKTRSLNDPVQTNTFTLPHNQNRENKNAALGKSMPSLLNTETPVALPPKKNKRHTAGDDLSQQIPHSEHMQKSFSQNLTLSDQFSRDSPISGSHRGKLPEVPLYNNNKPKQTSDNYNPPNVYYEIQEPHNAEFRV